MANKMPIIRKQIVDIVKKYQRYDASNIIQVTKIVRNGYFSQMANRMPFIHKQNEDILEKYQSI